MSEFYLSERNCAYCEASFQPINDSQRYCRDRCRYLAWKARNPPAPLAPIACPGCGGEFMPTNRKHRYCTPKCWHVANPGKRAEYQRRDEAKRATHPCDRCGSLTHNRQFCSKSCYLAAIAVEPKLRRVCVSCGVEWMRTGRATPECPDCRAKRAATQKAKVRRYAKVTKTRFVMRLHERPKVRSFIAGQCLQCGEVFVALSWTGARFCSEPCQVRAHRRLRRDRKRSAEKGERIYRRKVFERDSWTCRICRKPVQQDALVPHPKAPTVDHILPLALGGAHTYSNVQCAHFVCNSRKSQNVVQISFAA
jgi:hypothetical protein